MVEDGRNGNHVNYIWMYSGTPRQPFDVPADSSGNDTDQPFIDVELYY